MKSYEEFQKSSKNVKIVNFFNQTFFSFYNNYKYYQIILNNIKHKQEKSKMKSQYLPYEQKTLNNFFYIPEEKEVEPKIEEFEFDGSQFRMVA